MLRDYQQRAIDMLYDWFAAGNTGNPCLVLPTGAGKSHIVAALCKDALQNWPETRILMLTHQKELIAQNSEKLRQHWPRAPLGIYSAALKKRTLSEPITFAGIQSVAKRGADIGHVDLCIIDECHAINHGDTGSYRKLLAVLMEINPALRVVGLTATPYRLGHGMIHEGDDVIFDALIEPVTIEELIGRGFLSRLRSKHTALTLDTDGVKKQGGDYIASQLQAAVNTTSNNNAAVQEILMRGRDRKSWLIFCTGVEHAEAMAQALQQAGIVCACVTGATPDAERDRILAGFKAGTVQAVTNVSVLTTGFDHPGIDLLVMLRPTLSPGLYMQMVGRGLRVAEGKADCLVLDFAGNVATHGPIIAVAPPDKKRSKDAQQKPTKTCPQCQEIVAALAMLCPCCGHRWERKEPEPKPPPQLHNDDIMGEEASTLAVNGWRWRKHISRASGQEMLAVTYYGANLVTDVTEYLPIKHEGYAGAKSRRMLADMMRQAAPHEIFATEDNLDALAQALNKGKPPAAVHYRRDGKFHRVEGRTW